MAEVTKSIAGSARAVFSDAARRRLTTTDEPILTTDAATGCTLTYRFETFGGVLRLTGGRCGGTVIAVGCDPDQLNLVASLLLDGIRRPAP